MILGEALAADSGNPVLFMLALLETGSVALMMAFLVLANAGQGFAFSSFAHAGLSLSVVGQITVCLLLLVGFGATIGLLPFYEWFPATYGAGAVALQARYFPALILNAVLFRPVTWIDRVDFHDERLDAVAPSMPSSSSLP